MSKDLGLKVPCCHLFLEKKGPYSTSILFNDSIVWTPQRILGWAVGLLEDILVFMSTGYQCASLPEDSGKEV